jgi:hypothetical protein
MAALWLYGANKKRLNYPPRQLHAKLAGAEAALKQARLADSKRSGFNTWGDSGEPERLRHTAREQAGSASSVDGILLGATRAGTLLGADAVSIYTCFSHNKLEYIII